MTPPASASRGGPDGDGTPSRWLVAGIVVLVMTVAFAVRWAGIDQQPLHDELYNFLAARGWMERGELSILPGARPYGRGGLFTGMIVQSMRLFGVELEAARIPAVLLGTAVAGLLTGWLVRSGLVVAGLLAGGLVAIDPELIQLSQVSRFYTLQHLAFLIGAIAAAWAATAGRPLHALGAGIGAAVALLVAVQTQIITVIGLGGIGLFLVVWPESRIHREGRKWFDRYRVGFPLGVAAGLVAALGFAWVTGLLGYAFALATYADIWAEGARDNVRFYYAWLHDHYAALVVLFPALILLAYRRAPRITALSLAIFAVAFIAHSLMAWKTNRYLSYALPFFFAISAIGIVEGARWLRDALPRLVAELRIPTRARRPVVLAALGLILFSIFIGNRGVLVASRIVMRDPLTHFPLMEQDGGELSWTLAAPAIDTLLTEDRAFVSSNPLKAIHFLDRLDYTLNRSALEGMGGSREDFWVDPRFDRPVITRAESLERVRCDRETVVLVENVTLGNRYIFREETARYLDEEGIPVEMPSRSGISVFLLPRLSEAECAELGAGNGA